MKNRGEAGEDAGPHRCTVTPAGVEGVGVCRCGQWWMTTSLQELQTLVINASLRKRLGEHRWAVRHRHYGSIAEAARAAFAENHLEYQRRQRQYNERWLAKRKLKAAQWRRHVWPMILKRPCAYCGSAATQVDHIIPRCQGGTDEWRNLAAACAPCNSEKGGRTPQQWKARRLAKGLSWPPAWLAEGENAA